MTYHLKLSVLPPQAHLLLHFGKCRYSGDCWTPCLVPDPIKSKAGVINSEGKSHEEMAWQGIEEATVDFTLFISPYKNVVSFLFPALSASETLLHFFKDFFYLYLLFIYLLFFKCSFILQSFHLLKPFSNFHTNNCFSQSYNLNGSSSPHIGQVYKCSNRSLLWTI